MQDVQAQVVCVLGMHRSGTSLTARILNSLGVYLGRDERFSTQPSADNPKGMWEHPVLSQINIEIFSRLGGSWHDPPLFSPGWEIRTEFQALTQKARDILAGEFGHAALWGWKDPRTCLTLPFWQRLLPNMHYVICMRSPIDVAQSLERRDGFPFDKGVKIWLIYMNAILQHTSGRKRLFVFYDDLIHRWQGELQRLAHFLGLSELAMRPDVVRDVQAFIEKELQHHRTTILDVIEHDQVAYPAKALYALLYFGRYCGDQANSGLAGADLELDRMVKSFSRKSLEAAVARRRIARLSRIMSEWFR